MISIDAPHASKAVGRSTIGTEMQISPPTVATLRTCTGTNFPQRVSQSLETFAIADPESRRSCSFVVAPIVTVFSPVFHVIETQLHDGDHFLHFRNVPPPREFVKAGTRPRLPVRVSRRAFSLPKISSWLSVKTNSRGRNTATAGFRFPDSYLSKIHSPSRMIVRPSTSTVGYLTVASRCHLDTFLPPGYAWWLSPSAKWIVPSFPFSERVPNFTRCPEPKENSATTFDPSSAAARTLFNFCASSPPEISYALPVFRLHGDVVLYSVRRNHVHHSVHHDLAVGTVFNRGDTPLLPIEASGPSSLLSAARELL